MERKKTTLILVVLTSLIFLSSFSATGASSLLPESNIVEDKLESKLTYSTSVSVSKNSQEFVLGYSDLSEKDKVIHWLTDNLNAEIGTDSISTPIIHFKTSSIRGFKVQKLINAQREFGVRYIQDDSKAVFYDIYDPGDPDLEDQWYIDKIQAYNAWFVDRGDHSVKVAVLDTGCDMDHPDLVGNLDTVNDWDFVDEDGDPEPLRNGNNGNGHGTACAGLIAGIQGNNEGIAGIANISLVNLRVGYVDGDGDHIPWANVIDAINHAVDTADVDIISMSFGKSDYNEDLEEACNYSFQSGVLLIAAAGNSNKDLDSSSYNIFPTEFDSVMCVAATDENDNRLTSSNYGDETVDICAPGEDIYTTGWEGGYEPDFGHTSAAAPIIAGVAALIKSRKPHLSMIDIWNKLVSGSDDVGNPQIQGRVNAYYSVIDYDCPSTYQATSGAPLTGYYSSGSLDDLEKVDETYFKWHTDYAFLGPIVLYGFSVDFSFPAHNGLSRLKLEFIFSSAVSVKIYWATESGGGSTVVWVSGSLNFDCNGKKIDHITVSLTTAQQCYAEIEFDRVIIIEQDHPPSSYQATPGIEPNGYYSSGSLNDLRSVDETYFKWHTELKFYGPFIVLKGFSVEFSFPTHNALSRLKLDFIFDHAVYVIIYWATESGGGSTAVWVSGSLNFDCNGKKIDYIKVQYAGTQLCSDEIEFDRVVIVEYEPVLSVSSYQATPGVEPNGYWHEGDITYLRSVDNTYFTWHTEGYFTPPIFINYGFSVDFYFYTHNALSRLKLDFIFDHGVSIIIYWATESGGGSTFVGASGSLDFDCNGKKIDHITVSYISLQPCPEVIKFDRVVIIEE